MGEEFAGASDADLHLVKDEVRAILIASGAEFLEEGVFDDAHAAIALDWLDEDGGGFIAERALEAFVVFEGQLDEVGQSGSEAVGLVGC